MLAGTGIEGTSQFQLLDAAIRKNGDDIVNAINNNSGVIIKQASQAYKMLKDRDGNRKYIRLKSLSS